MRGGRVRRKILTRFMATGTKERQRMSSDRDHFLHKANARIAENAMVVLCQRICTSRELHGSNLPKGYK